jgi:hypothetical protein
MSSDLQRLPFKLRRLVLAALIEVHGDTHLLDRVAEELASHGIETIALKLRRFWDRVKPILKKGNDPILAEIVRQIIEEKKQ